MLLSERIGRLWDIIRPSNRRLVLCSVLALVFSIITVFGNSYYKSGSGSVLFTDFGTSIRTSLFGLSLALLYMALLVILFAFFDNRTARGLTQSKNKATNQESLSTELLGGTRKQLFIIVFSIIFICYLPFLIICYPGNLTFDGYIQINQFMGLEALGNWNPVVSTVIIGSIFSFGRMLGNDNSGLFLVVLSQSVGLSFVFTQACLFIHDLGFRKLTWLAVVFFAVCPIWPAYASTLIKDTLFLIFFFEFSLLVMKALAEQKQLSTQKILVLAAFALMTCLTRHNGFYAVILTLLMVTFAVNKTMRKQMLSILVAVFGIYMVFTMIVLPISGIYSSPMTEMMSVPYQQTARYVIMYSDEITLEEKEIIDQVIDYDRIPVLYNPENSDPIKFSIPSNTKLSAPYLGLWVRMFSRHPLTYLSATFHNTYGFYYPFENCDATSTYNLYIQGEPAATGDYDIHYVFSNNLIDPGSSVPSQMPPQIVSAYVEAWRSLPVIQLLIRPGFYVWILVVLSIYLVDTKRYWMLAAFASPAFLFLTCMASPINGTMRYAVPFIAVTIPILAYVFSAKNQNLHLLSKPRASVGSRRR